MSLIGVHVWKNQLSVPCVFEENVERAVMRRFNFNSKNFASFRHDSLQNMKSPKSWTTPSELRLGDIDKKSGNSKYYALLKGHHFHFA